MNIDIRLPNITADTDAGKLKQMHSYLHQLAQQLNWALNNIDSVSGTSTAKPSTASSAPQQDDPISNFNSIKGLIIKSADIVDAYYDKIDSLLKLSGYYSAEASFPGGALKYVQDTQNWISATDKKIEQDLVDKQTIYDENGNIKSELLVNGHIYSGIIEYAMDGEAIVGIEIGQTTTRTEDGNSSEKFTRFARFTADRLSFYDINGYEVAYISDYKLYITHVEITGSLQVGGYQDVVDPGTGGIVTKWVGGA